MKKLWVALSVVAAVSFVHMPAHALGPAAEAQTGYACTNSGGSLILRKGPSQKTAKLASIADGTAVSVITEVEGKDGMTWYKVKVGKRIGWVRYDYVCGL